MRSLDVFDTTYEMEDGVIELNSTRPLKRVAKTVSERSCRQVDSTYG